jgi:two-component system response regulator
VPKTQRYILLVEDNPDEIELTIRALKQHHLANDVVVISDGREALEYLFAEGKYADDPPLLPELLLLDINLPKVSGIEVLKRLRAHPRTQLVPVVMLTSSKEERDVLESYRLGANSYVQKPVSFDAFTQAVKEVGAYWLVLNASPWQLEP